MATVTTLQYHSQKFRVFFSNAIHYWRWAAAPFLHPKHYRSRASFSVFVLHSLCLSLYLFFGFSFDGTMLGSGSANSVLSFYLASVCISIPLLLFFSISLSLTLSLQGKLTIPTAVVKKQAYTLTGKSQLSWQDSSYPVQQIYRCQTQTTVFVEC